MSSLLFGCVEMGQRLRLTSLSRYAIEAAEIARVQDCAVRSPSRAIRGCHSNVRNNLHRATTDFDLSELLSGKESEEPAIWRPEWSIPFFRPRQRLWGL